MKYLQQNMLRNVEALTHMSKGMRGRGAFCGPKKYKRNQLIINLHSRHQASVHM